MTAASRFGASPLTSTTAGSPGFGVTSFTSGVGWASASSSANMARLRKGESPGTAVPGLSGYPVTSRQRDGLQAHLAGLAHQQQGVGVVQLVELHDVLERLNLLVLHPGGVAAGAGA